jgi:anti-anti-sigma regulatory factor
VLKITVLETPETVTLKPEGSISDAWVAELRRTWQNLAPSLGSRKLCLDLRGVTFADEKGRKLLAEIYGKTKAEILADSPLTKYFAEEAMQKISRNGKKGG